MGVNLGFKGLNLLHSGVFDYKTSGSRYALNKTAFI